VLLARGVEHDVWLPPEGGEPPRDPHTYDAVMVFGGAMHTDQEDRHPWLTPEKALLGELVEREVPVLGVCLGSQLLAEAAGGTARRAPRPEIGWHRVEVTDEGARDPLLAALAPSFEAFQWHSYEFTPPPGASALARSVACLQAFRLGNAVGIQFHAEVTQADAEAWIDDYRSDQDTAAAGVDPQELRRATAGAIAAWNELGRAFCRRFVDAVQYSA